MLSVGRREDGRKGLGFGGAGMEEEEEEEENELEEGEAYSDQEDDHSCIDPDALSYIDDKIQDVLGHFQKDFEAGVSAENLGAKFGGYGSFLPTYRRSPSIRCQPRSPQKVPNQNVTKSPYNLSVEVTNQNTSVTTNSSFPKNNTVAVLLPDNSGKRDVCMNKSNIQDPSSQHTSFNKTTNGADHKTLKVRIKVGPDNNLAINNAAIYSGLGLDISPSSSFEDSPDGSGGISPEFRDVPDESPKTIIQVMTCFAIPGGFLLSPLQHSLFELSEKDISFIKQCKKGKFYKGMPETTADFAEFTTHSAEVTSQKEKQSKLSEQKGRPMEIKNSEGKDYAILSREIDIETQAGQELASNSFNMPLSSISKHVVKKAEGQIVGNRVKIDTNLVDHHYELKASLKDKSTFTGSVKDKHFELIESTTNNGAGNSGNDIMHSRGQLNSKVSMVEKALEEQNSNNQKVEKSDLQREGKIKVEKGSDIINTHSGGHKRRHEQVAGPADYVKPSSSPYGEKILQGKDEISDRKKKLKASQTNSESLGEFSKDNASVNSSATLKEKKKTSHKKADHAEKKSKVLKSRKESGAGKRESDGNVNWDVKAEQLEHGVGSLNHSKGKQKAMKRKHEKEPIVSNSTFKERSGGKKVENTPLSGAFVSEPILTPLTCNAPAPDATVAPQAPVVIEEHWVCCDICQKWRLLPYGTNPGQLPKKWQCKLLSWLPGMNSCDVSEEETTNALNALYLAPAPENGASLDGRQVAYSRTSLASGVHLGQNLGLNIQNVPTIGKKKSALKEAPNISIHSTPTQFPNPVKRDEQASVKCRSSNDANQHLPSEINSSNKGGLGNTSSSTDFNAGKQKPNQKENHQNHGCYSDGGDNSGESEKISKSKSKREVDQDVFKASKKPKKASLQYPNKECYNHDVAAKAFEETDIGGYSAKVTAKNQSQRNNFPLSKDSKCDMKGNSSASSKKLRDEVQFITNGESKEHFCASDVEKSSNLDVSVKKRKVKEWQESQRNQEALVTSQHVVENGVIVKEALGETEPVKDKKTELSVSEGKRSTTTKPNSRMDKKNVMTRMALPSDGEHLPDGMDEEALYMVEKEHRPTQSQGNAVSLRESDFDSSKRDMTCAQPPVAANSSSSKVSGSCKSISNIQETKGSPVESVSSSPLRIPSIEKISCKRILERKDDVTNVDSSVLGSSKRCSVNEVDSGNGHYGKCRKERAFSVQQQSLEGHRMADSAILDSLGGTFDHLEKEAIQLSVGKSEERLHAKKSAGDDVSPTEVGGHPYKDDTQDLDKMNRLHLVNDTSQQKSGKSSSGFKEKHRGSKSDLDKSKLRVSGSYTENKDLHYSNNDSSCRLEATCGSCENEKDDFHEKDEKDCLGKKERNSKWMTSKRDNNSTFAMHENMDANCSSIHSNEQRNSDSKIPVVETRWGNPEFQAAPLHNEKSLNRPCSNGIDFPELPFGLGKSQLKLASGDKQETQSCVPYVVSSPLKASNMQLVDAVDADASKVVKQQRQLDIHNGFHHSNLRHATPNGPDMSSPMRKENYSAVLKEARDLKHMANRLKSEGLELESTGLYFEAALKFLHVAAIMELVNFDSAKQAEAALMYSETAKLCEFVAREYEKVKDMGAAALAYKCVEVAYLKAAYCKNPTTSKDRHELQAALQLLPPGESPSSSASDIDNLNNQVILGKSASGKAVSSPQVAGNHVIAVRHHHQVMRLIHYTNELNYAFEATRKSQISIAAASVSLEKYKVDGMSSVRKALDFNFHNVEGLLPLVRLSLKSIGR